EVNLGTSGFTFAYYLHWLLWNTVDVSLFPDLAAAADSQDQLFRQRVHHGHTYAVQTAGDLVGVIVELTAGVQHGHDDLGSRNAFVFVHVYRDATTVVTHGDGFVRM